MRPLPPILSDPIGLPREELQRFHAAEAAGLRRYLESSRRFVRSLEGQGAEAELLRQDVLELASLVDPAPPQVEMAETVLARVGRVV